MGRLPLPARDLDAELAADLRAAGDAENWVTRPALLRRLAEVLSRDLAPTVDRVLATGPGAEALGAAVALCTGLPFAVHGGLGAVHPGEEIAVVAADIGTARDLAAALGAGQYAGVAGSPLLHLEAGHDR